MEYTRTAPCDNCPFRNDIPAFLTGERVHEIVYSNGEFACHKTTVDSEDEEEGRIETEKSQHCAGLLILLEKEDRPHQMMRICERLGLYDRSKLKMDAPVYDSIEEAIEANELASGQPHRSKDRSTV